MNFTNAVAQPLNHPSKGGLRAAQPQRATFTIIITGPFMIAMVDCNMLTNNVVVTLPLVRIDSGRRYCRRSSP